MIVLVAFRSICESESTFENETFPSFFVGPHSSPHSLTASRKVERSSFFIFRIIMLSLPCWDITLRVRGPAKKTGQTCVQPQRFLVFHRGINTFGNAPGNLLSLRGAL